MIEVYKQLSKKTLLIIKHFLCQGEWVGGPHDYVILKLGMVL